MDTQILYSEVQENDSTLRMGGIILKGRARQERQPIHLILLIDTSGSMDSSEKLASVKKSIQLMLNFMSAEDRISLVSFADDSKCMLSHAIIDSSKRQTILYSIDALKATGSTNMSAALLEGRRLIESDTGRKQGMILLTDGHANIGVKSTDGLLEILERIHTECPSLTLSTVAYGIDHNTELLSRLAQTGGGGYNVVGSAEDVASVFGNILGGLVSISCQKIEVVLPPGSVAHTSYRCVSAPDGSTHISIGDLYAETEVSVLFKHAPTLGPIQISGVDMQSLNEIQMSVIPSLLSDASQVSLPLLMGLYRQRVSELLARVSNRENVLADLKSLLEELRADTRISGESLRDMLIHDLEHAVQILEHRDTMTQEETVLMAQQSAYIGMTRGMPSLGPEPQIPILRRQRRRNAFDSADQTMTSPFANGLQARYSEMMRTLVSQPNDEEPQNVL
jgi:Mg-chelatase subunit ChlD